VNDLILLGAFSFCKKTKRNLFNKLYFIDLSMVEIDNCLHQLNQNGVKISKQTFLNTIRKPVYTGKIYVKPWKNEPSQIVMGLQPPLITEEIYHLANDVLEGSKRKMKFHDDKSDLYPLKGFLRCPVHNRSLTAYACQSQNKVLICIFIILSRLRY
jgi:hypothetical protein